jgi:hypothetical protein
MQTSMENTAFPQFWAHDDRQIALLREDALTTQEWTIKGRPNDEEFDHSHRRTVWPSAERLEEYLATGFRTSTVNEYWQFQFDHKALDQYYHERASDKKQRLYEEGRVEL